MFDEDLDGLFRTDDFAVEVEYTPASGVAECINGIFDAESVQGVGGSVDVDLVRPMLTCKWSDVKDDVGEGDELKIVVDGAKKTFKVVAIHPDGTGIVELILEDQS